MSLTPAFIINYNRLTLPRAMADYLASTGTVQPIFVDNCSDYPPLLEYYKTTPHRVFRCKGNMGPTAVWYSGVWEEMNVTGRYIISDSDLDLSGIPKDFLHLLNLGLDRYPWACKAGFSLEINDLPNTPLKASVLKWETDKWLSPLDKQFYRAYIDTTFCLCRAKVHDFPAVRTMRPYTARHMPWYYTPENIPEDELYYIKTTQQWATHAQNWRDTYGRPN